MFYACNSMNVPQKQTNLKLASAWKIIPLIFLIRFFISTNKWNWDFIFREIHSNSNSYINLKENQYKRTISLSRNKWMPYQKKKMNSIQILRIISKQTMHILNKNVSVNEIWVFNNNFRAFSFITKFANQFFFLIEFSIKKLIIFVLFMNIQLRFLKKAKY